MGKVSKSIETHMTNELKSILFWLMMIFVVLFLFIPPFYQGLFNGGQWTFEGPIYRSLVWSSIALLIIAIYLFKNWKLRDHGDVLGVLIWLVPLSYLISVINSASNHNAWNSVYVHVMYATFYLIGLYFTRSKLGLNIIINAIILSGYGLVIYGLLNWFGEAHYQDAVLKTRLSGVFQYPNTYSAYLIALFLCSILLTGLSKRWYIVMGHSLMYVPILLSFFLTLSRGGLLVFPIIIVIYLIFLPVAKQIVHLVCIVLAGLASLLILERIMEIRDPLTYEVDRSLTFNAWIIIITASMIISAIVYSVYKFVWARIEYKIIDQKSFRLTNIIIPSVLIVLALLSVYAIFGDTFINDKLPSSIKNRVESIDLMDNDLLARTGYFSDAFSIMKDYPLFGAGGGGWANLYPVYQSYAYTSQQVHNFFLQYLIEVGWIGFIILLGLLIYTIMLFVKRFTSQIHKDVEYERIVFLIFVSTLFIHSIIDFNISFLYIGVLIFLSLGGMISFEPDSTINRFSKSIRYSKTFPVSMFILAIIMLFTTIRISSGNSTYISANDSQDYNQINRALDKALDIQPSNPAYVVTKIDVLIQVYNQIKDISYLDEALKLLNKLKMKEPFNRQMHEKEYLLYYLSGDLEEASDTVSEQLRLFPWDIHPYEKMILLQYELGILSYQNGVIEDANKHWDYGLSLYDEVLKKREQLNHLSYQKYDGISFEITPALSLHVSQIHFVKKNYEASSSILKGFVTNDFTLPINRQVAQWYLASLQKQGLHDDELLNLLTTEDPTVVDKIEELMKINP